MTTFSKLAAALALTLGIGAAPASAIGHYSTTDLSESGYSFGGSFERYVVKRVARGYQLANVKLDGFRYWFRTGDHEITNMAVTVEHVNYDPRTGLYVFRVAGKYGDRYADDAFYWHIHYTITMLDHR